MNSLQKAKSRAKKETGKGKNSKLDPHAAAIKYLKFEENYTIEQIQNFLLEDCNCKVATSTLHGFIKRRFLENKEIVANENVVKNNQNKTVEKTMKTANKKEIKKIDQQQQNDKNKTADFKGQDPLKILHSTVNIHDFIEND